MRYIILILLAITLIASCATSQLPDNATAEQKREALCLDAVTALAMADSTLSTGLAGPATAYWIAFRAGAAAGIRNYCPQEVIQKVQVQSEVLK